MKDGRLYTASSSVKADNVVGNNRFNIAVAGLVHGHVNGIIKGLCDAGAKLSCVYDSSSERIAEFIENYGPCKVVSDPMEIVLSDEVDLVVNCMMPDIRAEYSENCLKHSKAVFSDKPGFLTPEEGKRIEKAVRDYNGRYCIYFSEHFHHEGMICAQNLINQGQIGKVFNYIGMGPHRLNAQSRPSWFFNPQINGDVIADLGCHLIEQFLLLTGNTDARIVSSHKANIAHPEYPDFFDAGEVSLIGKNGASGYIKVDWFTPDAMPSWGDCRAFVYGTEGELEVRKYCDIANSEESDNVYICNNRQCNVIHAHNNVGFDFFGRFISDCLNQNTPSSLKVNGLDLSLFCIKAMQLTIEASFRA